MEQEKNVIPINEKLNVVESETENIKKLIYTIRGKQVMLDSDVAKLYHYTTKNINKAVKRNIERFPEDFCFQLTEDEITNLRFQNGTSSLEKENYGGRRYIPYAFTEAGIAMLSGVLKTEIAVKVSINIINAFIEMRKFILSNGLLFEKIANIEYKMLDYDKKFDFIFDKFDLDQIPNQKIFFEGQIYDAYSLIIDLIKRAKEKIIIIDNYIDDTILKMLTKKEKNVRVKIISSKKSNIEKLDIKKFNEEYPSLEIFYTDKFHDRFILIDDNELYHCGASLKDLGKKCFGISKIMDEEYIDRLKEKMN